MKKQVGRPKKIVNKKKSAKVFVNLTEVQKDKLMQLAEEKDLFYVSIMCKIS